MENRYVIFRVFANNKFANKKEVTKGEILASFSTIEDIANSEYYYSEKQVKTFQNAINSGVRQPTTKNSMTFEEAKAEILEGSIGLIKDRLERTGYMHNIGTDGMKPDEIKKLLKLNFGGEDKPVAFILLDLEHKSEVFANKNERKWFREINLINLTE